MERKRVGGKFVTETAEEKAARRMAIAAEDEVEQEAGTKPARKPSLQASRLRYCRKLVSHKVAEAMPSVVDTLVEEARKGSVEHTKEFLKLASAEQKKTVVEAPKRHTKGFAQCLLAELRSRQSEIAPEKPEMTDGLASE